MKYFQKSFFLLVIFFLVAHPVFAQVPNDFYYLDQWYLNFIGVSNVWDTTTGSDEIIVAVLDTGVDLDHEDLEEHIWINEEEKMGDGIDNDDNGYIDDVYGWDFVGEDATPTPDVEEGFDEGSVPHGTMIAGVIAAVTDNDKGVAGMSWNSKIMALRVMDNYGAGLSTDVTEAIEYAVAQGAKIINLSFSGYDADNRLRAAVREAYEAGVLVVAAVGNLSSGGVNTNVQPVYPACFGSQSDDDWVLGVAATNAEDEKTIFSNYGSTCVDISAPGENFYSTYYFDEDWEGFDEEEYMGQWSGTSLAAPVISGAAALLWSYYPSLTVGEIQTILKISVDPVVESGPIKHADMGAGRVNVERAFEIAANFAEPVSSVSVDEVTIIPSTNIIVVPAAGAPPLIRVFAKSGVLLKEFLAYDSTFTGGVRVAVGDVDGDGEDEIVSAPGPGGGPDIRVFEQDGTMQKGFDAFKYTMTSGCYIATGDVDQDGKEEIVVSTEAGGSSEVRVFNEEGEEVSQISVDRYEDAAVRVATGDMDGDKRDEIILSYGPGTEPWIDVYKADGTKTASFLVYAQTYSNGVYVSSGDINGDGLDEIVTGTDQGGGPHVQIYTGFGQHMGTFFAYDEAFRGGVRVAVGNLSDEVEGAASIITAAGPGGGPHIRVFNDHAALIGTFFTDVEEDRGGIFVGAWSY
ncbi:TPA: hypothetical protein DEP34_02680 [Candidatus Uhrbacteria bacterium]|uniref:Peptidase S8 and S53, subtilisin, kexin, sedolisin n=2 Tax=Candidatus Uhriibacteriota TaxID=1752732 RepID=A0A0G1SFE8_9BACT|nr:MAG: peptidase S8 and S53, subtilisin, kexin, sedolisin [Candidatus Uhrbacteria bacterium GW2011_GWF2_46_218]KKU40808.1 MAG: peptidase S8 and S53, subtilisin, kexin, sedolisin [Candidatus Uhrbacteria bacterium GW2011_GWE2_46_68]HBK34207.1 hypothetical protein [Candidatus Uhrbacteria bacterium]HCB19267.1 hypothetical protein [Candidatus Uhrbacteria bacterium]